MTGKKRKFSERTISINFFLKQETILLSDQLSNNFTFFRKYV